MLKKLLKIELKLKICDWDNFNVFFVGILVLKYMNYFKDIFDKYIDLIE